MDYAVKMKELEALWEDSFQLCRTMIDSCKNGEMKLTGSILKELNAFIKQSVDFLRFREAEEAFSDEQEQEDEAALKELDELDLPTFPEYHDDQGY